MFATRNRVSFEENGFGFAPVTNNKTLQIIMQVVPEVDDEISENLFCLQMQVNLKSGFSLFI